MTIGELKAWAEENDIAIVTADGLDAALIGVGQQFNQFLAIYDRAKCIQIFIDQGMSHEEAEEHFGFNVIGAYIGEGTPIFMINPEIF